MKVLLVSANSATYPDPVYPLGAAYVAHACAQAGHEVTTFDCAMRADPEKELITAIRSAKPDLIGMSLRNADDVSYPNFISYLPQYRNLVSACRHASRAPLVLGGPAVSLFAPDYYEELKPDYCVVGEGEEALVELCSQVERGEASPGVIRAERLPFSEFRSVSLAHFDTQAYYDNGGLINVQTKRGCGYTCSFCTFPYLEGPQVRCREPQHVVDELERIVAKLGIRHVYFVDSVFNSPEEHAREICEEILRRNLWFRWTCYVRPELKDLSILKTMKQAGCMCIELGTESMARPTIASLNKNLSVDSVMAFCEECRAVNLPFCHGLIFGAPGETMETVETTVANVEATRPTAAIAIAGVRVYPNTGMARIVVEEGLLADESKLGLEPFFYISEEVRDGLLPYLQKRAEENRIWIVPGLQNNERSFVKDLRGRRRRGPAWLFKHYEAFIGQS
jgi:radical SAM superfamily enzyme YgiQ (UPF0313 family)